MQAFESKGTRLGRGSARSRLGLRWMRVAAIVLACLASVDAAVAQVGSWTATGALVTPRSGHIAILLQNSKVLIAGGLDSNTRPLASAELYDPATGTWTPTGSMATSRFYHTATMLPNGKVLVAGGRTVTPNSAPDIGSCELYDPRTGTWSPTGAMNVAHAIYSMTLLPTGEALAVGAESDPTVEAYNPLTETWRVVGGYGDPGGVSSESMTLLGDGRVLIAGGCCPDYLHFGGVATYDAYTGIVTPTGALATPRVDQVSTLLPNGNVLVTGGQDINWSNIADPEIYDARAGRWSAAPGDTNTGASRAAVLLPNGRVLIAGGADTGGVVIYDSNSKQWLTGPRMIAPRAGHTATLLADGRVLVAGGTGAGAELYQPTGGPQDGWRPIITATTPALLSQSIGIQGLRFRGISEASNGNGPQNSPTNYPIAILRSANNQTVRYLSPDSVAGWTDTTFTSAPLVNFPVGPATLTIVVNGIPSAPVNLTVSKPGNNASRGVAF